MGLSVFMVVVENYSFKCVELLDSKVIVNEVIVLIVGLTFE